MPTTKTLVSGAVDLGANASYSPVNVPTAGDSLLIVAGSQAVITNPTALSAIALATVLTSSGFLGSLGQSGLPVKFSDVTSLQFDGGSGQHYLESTGTVTEARISTSQNGKLWISGGTFSKAIVFNGEVEFGAASTVTSLLQLGGRAILRQKTTGSDATSAYIKGGIFESERSVGSLHLLGAQASTKFSLAAAVTTLLRIAQGTHNHQASGTIALLEGIGGTLSTRGCVSPFAITNADLWKGFLVDDAADLKMITWTNQPNNYGYAGGGALKV